MMGNVYKQKKIILPILILFSVLLLSGCDSDNQSLDTGEKTFKGNACTDDCSGHEAGYNWAEEKGITDPDDCGGKSDSFIEGCRSYAEEQ